MSGRRRLSYAHVAAALALFLSLSSGALAARHYLVSSTKQIKPSVLAAIRAQAAGPAGGAGTVGLAGVGGPMGDPGAQGPVAPAPAVLLPGQTETGDWGRGYEIEEGRSRYRLTVSFPVQLAQALPASAVRYIPIEALPTAGCPGVGRAEPGLLCIYEGPSTHLLTPTAEDVFDPEQFEGTPPATGRSGFAIELNAEREDPSFVSGSFAVTAARTARPVAEKRDEGRT